MNAIQNAANVVAVTDDLIKSPGAMVWWRLGGTIPYSKLISEWLAAGLDANLLDDSCGPKKALRRAVDTQVERNRIRVRAPKGGWIIKVGRQDYDRNDTDFATEVKAHIDAVGRLAIEPENHPWASEIRAAYDSALETVTATDVTSLLVGLVEHCGGVALREGGGLYFVQPHRLAEWNAMTDVLKRISAHRIYSAPAMRSTDIVSAVLAGMEEEATIAAKKLDDDLSKDGDKALGARALKTRAGDCEKMLDKIGQYETLMGVKLDAIRQRMDDLKGSIAAAILAAEEE